VKSQIFENFRNTAWVLDMASGKGQDLFRYIKYDMQNLLCLEIDKTALMELISRKHDFASGKVDGAMAIYTHAMDLNNDYKSNISILEDARLPIPAGFDLIICNLAFHYLIASKNAVQNIVKFINHYLKPGGRFVFTAFDGQKVYDLLEENKGHWDAMPRFSIKSNYKEDVFMPVGQKIKVLLPFSKNEYYEEYLVNIKYIEKEFESYGISLESNKSFGDYLDDYKRVNNRNYQEMDDIDKKYVSLYHSYYFYKKGKNKAH
jgi:SAM-dependent methyltransferase